MDERLYKISETKKAMEMMKHYVSLIMNKTFLDLTEDELNALKDLYLNIEVCEDKFDHSIRKEKECVAK